MAKTTKENEPVKKTYPNPERLSLIETFQHVSKIVQRHKETQQ